MQSLIGPSQIVNAESFLTAAMQLFQVRLSEFNRGIRINQQVLELNPSFSMDSENLLLKISSESESGTLIIPLPKSDASGIWTIGNRIQRVLCPLMVIRQGQTHYRHYLNMLFEMIFYSQEELFAERRRQDEMRRILFAFFNRRGRMAIDSCQRFLNKELINLFPLAQSTMYNWAMNHRLMIFDPAFQGLPPEKKLEYQKAKNRCLYPWSSIGLSDGAAMTENYILQVSLPQFSCFGRHHNPIRNLYSTLSVKGEFLPTVVSESAYQLQERGISRKGYNWMTVFLDLPENFEDQILVSTRHRDKVYRLERSFTIYGDTLVEPNQELERGAALGVHEDGSMLRFENFCDRARVKSCEDGYVPLEGHQHPVRFVTVEMEFCLREGFKITNQHGNKGIVALRDLGQVWDPVRGQMVDIDVIASARSVQKRKNFGQVMEALTTLLRGTEQQVVVPDETRVELADIERALIQDGYPKAGTLQCHTPWGQFEAISGWVHWGITKIPQEQLWDEEAPWSRNLRGLRDRGNKISPVEFSALLTLLGPESKTVEEILSYAQGAGEVRELLRVLRSLRGEFENRTSVVRPEQLVYIPAGMGTLATEEQLVGTIADPSISPDGFYLSLPFQLVTVLGPGPRQQVLEMILPLGAPLPNYPEDHGVRATQFLYIPNFDLRRAWQHPTGKFILSDTSQSVNQILEALHRFQLQEMTLEQAGQSVLSFVRSVGSSLSTKNGRLSNLLLSVRYPWSSKATATLSDSLPENTVEIHETMAAGLRVQNGDLVLVERFPCLGFMSLRIQRVRVTNDPDCEYVIRASKNSLVSMNLDFDGDVLFIMSFHTDATKQELLQNFQQPHPRVGQVLAEMNGRKVPRTGALTLQELELRHYPVMNPEEHAELNTTSLGVKAFTGPVIALCYNLMRLVESTISYSDREVRVNVEVFLDKVGNSVFSLKHGLRSLREECIRAVCMADVEALIRLGFPEFESRRLCQLIEDQAASIGIRGRPALYSHYQNHLEKGRSNIINLLVRMKHHFYFATRANLHPLVLLAKLETAPNDLPSFMAQMLLSRVDQPLQMAQIRTRRIQAALEQELAAELMD